MPILRRPVLGRRRVMISVRYWLYLAPFLKTGVELRSMLWARACQVSQRYWHPCTGGGSFVVSFAGSSFKPAMAFSISAMAFAHLPEV